MYGIQMNPKYSNPNPVKRHPSENGHQPAGSQDLAGSQWA